MSTSQLHGNRDLSELSRAQRSLLLPLSVHASGGDGEAPENDVDGGSEAGGDSEAGSDRVLHGGSEGFDGDYDQPPQLEVPRTSINSQ